MERLRYLLVTDGSSDRVLLHVLNWLLTDILQPVEIEPYHSYQGFGNRSSYGNPLTDKIAASLKLYDRVDLLFVHRDAENETPSIRLQEIAAALEPLAERPTHICLIPVRMTEAWLLFDEGAIRQAAGNPNGRGTLSLPALSSVEKRPDPKEDLYSNLRRASGLQKRRLKRFNVQQAAQRVAELIQDFSPLRQLAAFQRLEQDLRGWLDG